MTHTSHLIRVLVADDHPLVRNGVRLLIGTIEDMTLVGEAANGYEALDLARSLRPDVLLLDLVMPQMDGLEVLRRIKEELPDVRVLVVTSFADDDKVLPAIRAGALGYFLKEASPDLMVQAIRDVYRGELWLHPTIARKVIRGHTEPPKDPPRTESSLTARELDVLRLIARGLSNQAIADELVIGITTVRYHVSHVLTKLHLASRTQAALYAVQQGLLDQS